MSLLKNKSYKSIIKLWLFSCIILIVLMILLGGLTRLTGSGLSITQWDLFSGILPPFSQIKWVEYFELYKTIPQYKLINNNISLEDFKIIFYWEYYHRLLGRIIGLVILAPFLYFLFKKCLNKDFKISFFIVSFLILCQGFMGWYMVSSGLSTNVTVSHFRLSAHLFLAFVILSCVLWNYLNINEEKNISFFNLSKKNIILMFFIFLLFLQIVLGAFVSGLDAGKIYQTWPMMNNNFFPDDITYEEFFDLNNRSTVQFLHRIVAYLIFFVFLLYFYGIIKNKIFFLYKNIFIVFSLLIVQMSLGIITLLSGVNIYLASTHQITSVFLLISSLILHYKNFTQNINNSDL